MSDNLHVKDGFGDNRFIRTMSTPNGQSLHVANSLSHALLVIEETYGVNVKIKSKTLQKFGENELVGTSEATVMTLPAGVVAETYATTNAIDKISSADNGDTQEAYIEGHTVDGSGNFTFTTQTVTMTGQTAATLTTPLARVSRVANNGTTANAGHWYVHESDTLSSGVPTTDAKVHLIVPAGENQSLKSATTFSSVDYAIVTGLYASVNKKANASADIRFKVRLKGGVFQTKFKIGISNTAPFEVMTDPFFIIPANADCLISAEASTTGVEVSCGFNAYLATIA